MKSQRLNILVLHNMGLKDKWFKGVADIELMFPKYDKHNNYIVHNCFIKIPDFVKKYPFDAIIMMSTFMDKNVRPKIFTNQWLPQIEFLKNSKAKKIVFSQDDYWFSEIRDKFYLEYKVDIVYSVCAKNSWKELIPRYIASGGKVYQGYTTYITPYMLNLRKKIIRWDKRKFDVVYRAIKSPLTPNEFGNIKSLIGHLFLKSLVSNKLKTDISNEPSKLIYGEKWLRFIGNSRAILGANSGSSIKLRNHNVFKRLLKYQKSYPFHNLQKLKTAVFNCDDINKKFTAISPRNIEAAMLGVMQILTPGPYSNLLKPYVHYLPLKKNCSNIKEICRYLGNKKKCLKIITNCLNTILKKKNLHVEYIIQKNINFIKKNNFNSDYRDQGKTFHYLYKKHKNYCLIMFYIKQKLMIIYFLINNLIPKYLKFRLKIFFLGRA